MISDNVINLHPMIALPFQLPDGADRNVEFVIDTGFTGFLTLPEQDVTVLRLPFTYFTRAYLADQSEVRMSVHEGMILCNGTGLHVNVLATGERLLLGTGLLKGHELVVQFTDSGRLQLN